MLEKMKPLLKEPLVHFLGAGLLIFLVLGSGSNVDPDSRRITVTEAKVSLLAKSFSSVWQRQPTGEEIDGLIRDYIREEIYYREALRLGLDENDAIIRRRMRTKMEELATAQAQSASPSDAELQKMLDDNSEKYASSATFNFEQIWLGSNGDAKAALAKIQGGALPSDVARIISLPAKMAAAQSSEIDRNFGEGFAAKLTEAKRGEWAGPIISGFGIHLVKVSKIKAAQTPKLSQVRQALENDWRSSSANARKEAAFQALLQDYDIEIAKPE